MQKPLTGSKIAILASSGFNEKDLTAIQRPLIQAGGNVRIISPDHGLLHSWAGDGWGHHYAIDVNIGTALGADYDMLVIPGGSRSMDKLRLTAHTKRFIGSFMATGKPVAAFGDALNIMIYTDQVRGVPLAGPAEMKDLAVQAGANWRDEAFVLEGNLLTGACADDVGRQQFAAKAVDFFTAHVTMAARADKAA